MEASPRREPISNVSDLKEGFYRRSYALQKNDLNGLNFNSQSLRERICQEGEKKCGLLIHASIPTTYTSLVFCMFFLFLYSFSSFFLPLLPFVSFFFFFCSHLPPFIPSAMEGFAIFTLQPLLAPYGRPSRAAHWPADCSATTIALNVLVTPLPIQIGRASCRERV